MRALTVSAACLLAAIVGLASPAAAAPPLLTTDAQLTLDEIANVSGGVSRGDVVLDKLEGVAQFDGSAIGRSWLTARLDAGVMNGRTISSNRVGDIQGVDNIEAIKAFRIFNAWVAVSGANSGAKLGIIDLNSEFDVHNVAALFLNSSFGIGPELSHSGLNGPSIYPNSGLGVVAWSDDGERGVRYRLGAFDGVPNAPDQPQRTTVGLSTRQGALLIAEADTSWAARNRLAIGVWGYTSALPKLTRPEVSGHGSAGVYATLEATILTIGSAHRLDGWVRGGWSNATYNIVSGYGGGGLVLKGVFAAPRIDSLGLAVAHADLSPGMEVVSGAVPGAGVAGSGVETTVELTYQLRVHDMVTVQPDAQYVFSPAGRPDIPNAVVLGLRLLLAKG